MTIFTKVSPQQKPLAQNTVALPNGNTLITEIVQSGPNQYITGTIMLDQNGHRVHALWCGSCDGQQVGCVDCPNNDPVLDCVNRTVYCAS